MTTKTKKPKTTKAKTVPTRTIPLKGSSWWEDLLDERDARWGDTLGGLWGGAGRGARGLGTYLSGVSWGWTRRGDNGPDATWEYAEGLRFAGGFARIVAGATMKRVNFFSTEDQHEGKIPYANLQSGAIMLDPAPLREFLDGSRERDSARTIVAGVAIHEAAHLRATPLDWLEGFLKRHKLGPFQVTQHRRDEHGNTVYDDAGHPVHEPLTPPEFPEHIARAARAMVEDAFVETVALATYPGYTAYLDDCWAFVRPEATIASHAREVAAEPDGPKAAGNLMEIIQDRSRRYTPPGDDYRAALDALPADMQAYVEAGYRILRRAHDHTLTNEARWDLAADLARLMARGEVAEADRPELGDRTWAPDADQLDTLDSHAHKLVVIEGLLDGDGRANRDAEPLDRHTTRRVEDAVARDMRKETVTLRGPGGTREVAITWLDLEADAAQAARDRREVAPLVGPLARKLAFRAERPERHVGAQRRGRLDDRRLVEIPLAVAAGREPRAFTRREAISAPSIALPLLVDMSGSMSGRIGPTRRATMLFHDALARLKQETNGGVDFSIHGHSSRYETGGGDQPTIYRIVDERHPAPDRIGRIGAISENYDGPALAAIAEYARRRWRDRRRVLIYLNDGSPCGDDYGGDEAEEEIAAHRRHLKAQGTDILTVFMGDGADHDGLARMYGPEGLGYLVVEDETELPDAVSKVLRNILKWHA